MKQSFFRSQEVITMLIKDEILLINSVETDYLHNLVHLLSKPYEVVHINMRCLQ